MAFKMKGHALPGIKQRKSTNKKDGRAASSAFQAHEPEHKSDQLGQRYIDNRKVSEEEHAKYTKTGRLPTDYENRKIDRSDDPGYTPKEEIDANTQDIQDNYIIGEDGVYRKKTPMKQDVNTTGDKAPKFGETKSEYLHRTTGDSGEFNDTRAWEGDKWGSVATSLQHTKFPSKKEGKTSPMKQETKGIRAGVDVDMHDPNRMPIHEMTPEEKDIFSRRNNPKGYDQHGEQVKGPEPVWTGAYTKK